MLTGYLCFHISRCVLWLLKKNLSKDLLSVSFLNIDVDNTAAEHLEAFFACCQDKIFTGKVKFHQQKKTFLRLSPATNKKLK